MCHLVLQTLLLRVPFFCTGAAARFGAGGGGVVGSRSKQTSKGLGYATNAIGGRNLRLLDEAGSWTSAAPATREAGQSEHAESTQQGSFPEVVQGSSRDTL